MDMRPELNGPFVLAASGSKTNLKFTRATAKYPVLGISNFSIS